MKGIFNWYGQSLVFNSLFILLNLAGLTFITMSFHPNFETNQLLFGCIGGILLLASIGGIIVLKGKEFMTYVSRILVGGLFIVSGLIKANDPYGFSYKLEEYFEDGALAFRIKEWFGAPGFSLEFLIDYALFLSVFVCILEIVLGVLVIIGGKIKMVSWLLLLLMVFFTFLTWHTANCNPDKKFIDRDTYLQNDPIGLAKLDESKTNKEIKVVSKNGGEIVIDELKSPQCVSDCGCFGDAMKGSVGRSLTPQESLWKDYLLMYFVIWIFISQRKIRPNTTIQNMYVLSVSLLVVTFFSFVFGWYFPVFFAFVSLVSALWMKRIGGKYLGNFWMSSAVVITLCVLFVSYVLNYEPLKDYRPYAEGSNLKQKMNDGIEGKYLNLLVYKNLKNGSIKEFEGSSQAYINSKIWEKTNLWKYDTMVTKEVIPTKLPSISTQFNPIVRLDEVGFEEKKIEVVKNAFLKRIEIGYLVLDKENNEKIELTKSDYEENYSDTSFYKIIREIGVENPDFNEVSIRNYLVQAPRVFVLFSKDLEKMNVSNLQELKGIIRFLHRSSIPVVFISNASHDSMKKWCAKYHIRLACFTNDATELKVVARSNPALMYVEKGIVVGKYPNKSIPTVEWIKKHLLKK
jgi:uncharacterized membrane protein YphA (DoxX/SURF4 family)